MSRAARRPKGEITGSSGLHPAKWDLTSLSLRFYKGFQAETAISSYYIISSSPTLTLPPTPIIDASPLQRNNRRWFALYETAREAPAENVGEGEERDGCVGSADTTRSSTRAPIIPAPRALRFSSPHTAASPRVRGIVLVLRACFGHPCAFLIPALLERGVYVAPRRSVPLFLSLFLLLFPFVFRASSATRATWIGCWMGRGSGERDGCGAASTPGARGRHTAKMFQRGHDVAAALEWDTVNVGVGECAGWPAARPISWSRSRPRSRSLNGTAAVDARLVTRVFKMTQRGLSSFAGHPAETAASLHVLVEEAMRVGSSCSTSARPSSQAAHIVAAVSAHLRGAYPFALPARGADAEPIMDGENLAWVKASYLLGT
ncbi:hypothetical protein DFH09DRAFT_1088421, partial [Mycena vulgaris]